MTRLGSKLKGTGGGGGAATVAFAAALLLWGVVTQQQHRAAAPPATINGKYKVRVAGYGAGEGSCVVTGEGVDVDCKVVDDGGNEQRLRASGLALDGYRFHGSGRLGETFVRVAGRIEPADAASSKPRVLATFAATDGRVGRMVGTHE